MALCAPASPRASELDIVAGGATIVSVRDDRS